MRFKKPLDVLLKEAEQTGEGTLKRTLGAGNLIALGIGAIIGAGLFVRTAAAAADHAGPSVTLAFILAAIGCGLAGLCYAEFASMIPIAGSAYTYSYATMGEFVAWIIGWDSSARICRRRCHCFNSLVRIPQQAHTKRRVKHTLPILPFTVPKFTGWYTRYNKSACVVYYSGTFISTYPGYTRISQVKWYYCNC